MGTDINRRTRIAAEFRAEMARNRISQVQLSAATGITKNTLRSRLQGVRPFTVDEIDRVCYALNMSWLEVALRSEPDGDDDE